MSAKGVVPERGRRHPMWVVTEARRLHAAGWNDVEIVRMLAERGVTVTKTTVGRWVKPQRESAWRVETKRAAAARAVRAGRRPMGRPNVLPEFKFARMTALRDVGLSVNAIAKMMRFDFGDEITIAMVRYAFDESGSYPRSAA